MKKQHALWLFLVNTKKHTLFLILFLVSQLLVAQSYIPIGLSGFNNDAIVDQGEDPKQSGYLDKPSNGYAYHSKALRDNGGLSQQISSSGGVTYQLAPFSGNNALTLTPDKGKSGTLTFATPVKTGLLYILGTATESNAKPTFIVNYDDGSKSQALQVEYKDWYSNDGNGTAVFPLGRVRTTNGDLETRYNFSMYERAISTDNTKNISSVTVSIEDNQYLSLFAISAYDISAPKPDMTLYMIPNSHLDTQWNWTVETTIDQYVKNTLNGNFELFELYPDYKFNFEGAIKYMFAKEYYPEQYERLKEYIKKGNWQISGGSIDANDVMTPSAESIIRNFLYGQEFYKNEFGVQNGGRDIMLPDCFGFPYSLPTLGAHCGVTGFHTAKLGWGSAYPLGDMPNFGLWRGVDGSEIYAVYKPGAYDQSENYAKDMSYDGDAILEISKNIKELGVPSAFRYIGNRGDRGGSLNKETAESLVNSTKSDGPVTIKIATPTEFFGSITPQQRSGLPVWNNELPMEAHGVGCYTSQAILKYWNRKNELLADATEKSSVLADWMGVLPYQSKVIRDSWTNVIWHQFHDDLPGTSIAKAYMFSYNDHILAQKNFSKTRDNAVGAIAKQMNTEVTGIPIVVYNPLSIARQDVVEASIDIEKEPTTISVYNPSGSVVAAQKIAYKNGKLSFIFLADVPSLGYSTYDLRVDDNSSASVASSLSVTANTLENDEYKVTIDANGDVSSVYDKKQNKELLKSPIRMSLSQDQPGYWSAWEISRGDIERDPYSYVGKDVTVSIAENGPLRVSLKVSRTAPAPTRTSDVPAPYTPSEYVQYIQLTSGASKGRIDFVNEIDWRTTETLLKAEFDLNATNEYATFDLSIGTIDRKTRQKGDRLYEVVGHQWADVTHNDNSYGVSILNDCKYGWDKATDNKIRLTLIHTPKSEKSDGGGDYAHHKNQDLGLNKFTYSFYRHANKWDESTQWEAAKLNQPLTAYETTKHSGVLGKEYEFVKLNTEKVAIKALKKAEASDDMIVRVYELVGDAHNNVEIEFPTAIVSASEVNGVEEYVGAVSFSGNKLTFNITKYQPKTFAVKLANSTVVAKAPSSTFVDLEYNVDVMSSDASKTDGQFGARDYLYPAELLSDNLEVDGIKFKIGSRNDGQNNAVRCDGQKVQLPQDASVKKLYILAASQSPYGAKAAFDVDGKVTSAKVDYYAGYAGQWGSVYDFQNYVGSNVAFVATHRHNKAKKDEEIEGKNDAYNFLYIYKYVIEIDANAKVLTLPKNDDIFVFAVTLSDNENDNVTAIAEKDNLPKFDLSIESSPLGEILSPVSCEASAYTNEGETAWHAANNDPLSKWCDNKSSDKWLQYNFDEPVEISQWHVLHAGIERETAITSEFALQRYDKTTSKWVDVDVVSNNKSSVASNYVANKTVRSVTPFVTDKVRLKVIKGEADGNTSRIHKFEVYGQYVVSDNDASLSSLSIAEGALTPDFDPDVTEYTVLVGASLNEITIDAAATNPKASIEGLGKHEGLNIGETKFVVTVTAKDGATKQTYTINVVKSASVDAHLSELAVSVGVLDPAFDANKTEYIVNVDNDINSIEITATTASQEATLVGDGQKDNLKEGDNRFEVIVTAQDGTTTMTYVVNVIRRLLSPDAELHSIKVNGEQWDISETYDMGCSDNLRISIETEARATVNIGHEYSEVITTGTLKNIDFRITAEDGSYKDYTLQIERRYGFDEVVSVKWNNTLMLDLKKIRLDGYTPLSYQWYKDDKAIAKATKATYSAGPSKVDLLTENSSYYVAMKMENGMLRTCPQNIKLKAMAVYAYPNPVKKGESITIDASIDDSLLEGANIEVFDMKGNKVLTVPVKQRTTQLMLPQASGNYVVKFVSKEGFSQNIKTVVQ